VFQTRTGLPGHLAVDPGKVIWSMKAQFQTRTGFPGHLAFYKYPDGDDFPGFQTRTGFPGHLAAQKDEVIGAWGSSFKPERASQAI